MNSRSRTAEYGARSRGQTFNYLPEDVTIVGSQRFADWVREQFGKHGPKVMVDEEHPLYDPRVEKVFEPEWLEDIKALSRDVRENKVEVPIGVTLGETLKGQPQVIDVYGRRRILGVAFANQALREQGVKEQDDWIVLPAIVRRGTMDELRAVMLAENDNRKDNPPSVQAENVYRAVVLREQPIQKIANRMGKPVVYLERLLKLRECEPAAIRGVDAGVIPLESIDQIRKLPPQKQTEQAERLMAGPAKSGRTAAAQVRADNPEHAEPPRSPAPTTPPEPPPPPCRRRKALVEERDALKAKLADPKQDAFRRVNEAALATILWVLAETDERPSERKGRGGAPAQASGAAA